MRQACQTNVARELALGIERVSMVRTQEMRGGVSQAMHARVSLSLCFNSTRTLKTSVQARLGS